MTKKCFALYRGFLMKETIQHPFQENDLVTWHQTTGQRSVPLPGVVVRLRGNSVVIRTRLHNSLKEVEVDARQLAPR
jgi:ribosomal protein L35AE/L33A